MSIRRGPDLPYLLVAGVTPWGRRWVAASAKIAGTAFSPESPKVYERFADVLDERPAFAAVVVNGPIGYLAGPGVRSCDHEARQLLQWRSITVRNAPTRSVLLGETPWTESNLDAASAMLLPAYRELMDEMSPYRQRTIYEGHPELSFMQLNKDVPLRRSKRLEAGRDERREVLQAKIPGINKVIDADLPGVPRKHLLDAAALLWTARRVHAHAAKRLPSEAQWDGEGLRMEIVY
jgi:predicted RNase H-like nuclease